MTTRTETETTLLDIFAAAHAEGCAVMSSDEFLLAACVHGLSSRDVSRAQRDGLLRCGLTGFWMKEAPDAGAVLVMRAAMGETDAKDEE